MPFAAFFVAFLLLLCIPRRSRKLAVCLLLGALAAPLLRTVATMFLYRAASALLQPIGDSPLARGMGDYAEVFSLLFIIQLSVGAMFLLLVAQLLTVANLTVMLR